MKDDLINRWLELSKPFSVTEFREEMRKAVNKPGLGDEMFGEKLEQIMDLMNEKLLSGIWRMNAEEHFSDDSLAAAVAFFESDLGQKYMQERKRVSDRSMEAVKKEFTDCLIKALGLK